MPQRVITLQQEVEVATSTLRASEQRWRVGAISQFDLPAVRRQYTSAQDDAIAAKRLWSISEELTGVGYGPLSNVP